VLARFDVIRREKLGNWKDPLEFETPLAKTEALPDGYTLVIPHIVVRGVDAAVAFYGRRFEPEPRRMMPVPDGHTMYGELRVGGARSCSRTRANRRAPIRRSRWAGRLCAQHLRREL